MAPPAKAAILHDRETVHELQSRIRSMQRTTLDARAVPTHPALAGLLPQGALAAGSVYVIDGSTSLALGLLQAPSAAGSWCAVVGVPDLGVEAAAAMGIDLERLVLVPHPGDDALAVLSALIDVVSVVLVRMPLRRGHTRVSDAVASRIAARLRQREGVLVSLGDWPRHEARMRVTASDWGGIGSGFGYLATRRLTVDSSSIRWGGRSRSRRLLMSSEGFVDQAGGVPLAASSHVLRGV
ncbi:MAG TPA: hypothetical protein VNT53_05260 [Pseudolysinimonas sp.]|nr:hypothetical protein [Pseudolysinimonas sp.]